LTNQTPDQDKKQINAVPWTNGAGLVTGATLLSILSAIVGTFYLYGPLAGTNAWTGANTFTGPVTIQGVPFPFSEVIDPTNPQWAGGADPTGVRDSSPAVQLALSVPSTGATAQAAGSGYFVGDIITPDQSNVGLICSVYPTFRVSGVSGGGINQLTLVNPGLCANTTPVPATPSSSITPTFYSASGARGLGATILISWAARNAKVQFPCGTFLLNESVGAIHDNTEIAGNGDCTVIKTGVTISGLPNWGGNFGSIGTPSIVFANADYANGNSNVRIHDIKFDLTATLTGVVAAGAFVQAHNFKIDHNHFINPIPVNNIPNSSGVFFLQSDQFWEDKNVFEGGLTPIGLWQGSSNWWITNNYFDGKGAGQSAMQPNGLGSAQVYPPISNTTFNGIIDGNYITNFKNSGINMLGLCSPSTLVCGLMNNITVSNNVISGVTNFAAIIAGGGDNININNNRISNVGTQCIILQGDFPGVVTSNSSIIHNTCANANRTAAVAIDGITAGATNGIITNLQMLDNQVLGGGYRYATSTLDSPNQDAASATVASTSGTNTVGDILTAVGGTLAPGITATRFKVTTVDGSNNITGVTPVYKGSYSVVPANPVSVTSSGAGTGITLNITWENEGMFNTSFRSGIEDAGTTGTEAINGTYAPSANYGSSTFKSKTTFSDTTVGIDIASPNAALYSQLSLTPAGTANAYHIGVGGGSETISGVAGCAYLYAVNGAKMRWRVCSDGFFNINPINGTAAVATLDVNGTGRVAPGTLAAAGTCNAGSAGKYATINDSTVNTWGSTITGSGASTVLGFCNGTNWTVFGK
jgi:hypothetical protein